MWHLKLEIKLLLESVQFSHSVVFDSLRLHESQHVRPPCPSPTSGVHSDSRLWSQWCHPAISSSVVPFSSCPQCGARIICTKILCKTQKFSISFFKNIAIRFINCSSVCSQNFGYQGHENNFNIVFANLHFKLAI